MEADELRAGDAEAGARERRVYVAGSQDLELLLGVVEGDEGAARLERVEDGVAHRAEEVLVRALLRRQLRPAAPELFHRLAHGVLCRLAIEEALCVVEDAPMQSAIRVGEQLLELERDRPRWRCRGDEPGSFTGLGLPARRSHPTVG